MENTIKLLENSRVLIINGEIDDDACAQACMALLHLEDMDPEKDITIMINSPGGSISAGFMLVDTMRVLKCDVETICMGLAASMGAVILMAGTKGKRKALTHCRIMLHQPLGGAQMMQAADFEIAAQEMSKVKREIYEFISACTGKTYRQVLRDCDRNFWLDACQAQKYGIIDSVVTKEDR